RYFNVFGPRQDPLSQYSAVIPRFISAFLAGNAPVIFGDGEQSRDFTYIDNVVDGTARALTTPGNGGKAFNVAAGHGVTLNELVRQLLELIGGDIEPSYEPPRPGDVKNSKADVSRAEAAFGYRPSVPIEEGLRRTLAWFEQSAVASAG
ncbi:MAG: UDP-N-acetylglucosamine/UDP-N-acetylgalactosamine 4-epimerase, partial [Thermoleophilaceae bacterium]|nr:UDP-N-acetylglucosamine/UDP-N-acetylgalactosamine 4-epimerase [Thermoleophilaceae bacterium]